MLNYEDDTLLLRNRQTHILAPINKFWVFLQQDMGRYGGKKVVQGATDFEDSVLTEFVLYQLHVMDTLPKLSYHHQLLARPTTPRFEPWISRPWPVDPEAEVTDDALSWDLPTWHAPCLMCLLELIPILYPGFFFLCFTVCCHGIGFAQFCDSVFVLITSGQFFFLHHWRERVGGHDYDQNQLVLIHARIDPLK